MPESPRLISSGHFTEEEFHRGRGWLVPDESRLRYSKLALYTLEPLREAFGGRAITILSGERGINTNGGGRPSSCHLPPSMRADILSRKPIEARAGDLTHPELRGQNVHAAAADIRVAGLSPELVYHVIYAAMAHGIEKPEAGLIPRGGVFYYGGTSQFVHVDNRGYLARDVKLTPPSISVLSPNEVKVYHSALNTLIAKTQKGS